MLANACEKFLIFCIDFGETIPSPVNLHNFVCRINVLALFIIAKDVNNFIQYINKII